ncbi:hypothetical protein ZEAMMB73_Zm00001d048487 [Zea mays]|uniref:Uncharacterized protein n=1 Tax=Zea mays TaxID=4577 RepID=A0A1D6PKZ2_MAIZE|nr:hypothetical protein ZEAMMB73_Zm00001d048487 [Zea mays]
MQINYAYARDNETLFDIISVKEMVPVTLHAKQSMFYLQQASRHQAVSFLSESVSPQNLFGHPNVERCPFLRNINGATTFSPHFCFASSCSKRQGSNF